MSERDDIIICRCESVTLGQVQSCLAEGGRSSLDVKTQTRAGMGICQGRICRAVVADIVAAQTGAPEGSVLPFSFRPPLRPVPVGDLASMFKGEAKLDHGH